MSIIQKLFWWVSLLLVSSLLFSYKLNSICIIALVALWLIEGGFRLKWNQLIREPFFIMNAFLFILYLVSIALSTDKATARFFVEKNLSLIALPVVLLSRIRFTQAQIHILCKVFIAGTGILMSIATVLAISRYFSTYNYSIFFYHKFSSLVGISAIVASVLCIVSLGLLLSLHGTGKVKWLLATLFSVWLILLSSKLFLLALFLLLLINIWSQRTTAVRWAIVAAMVILAAIIVFTPNPIHKRFSEMRRFRSSYLTDTTFNKGMYFDGLSLRLIYVRFSMEMMKEDGNYLLGVGTGDADTLLKQKILAYDMYKGDGVKNKEGYLKYGFHNELLQKFVQLGIIGLSVFIAIIVYCWYMAIRYRNRILLHLLLVFTLSFFTDTLLEQQFGLVIFFTFTCLAINEIRMQQGGQMRNLPVQ